MLFLLPYNQTLFDNKELEFRDFAMGDLFEIFTGVFEDRHLERIQETNKRLHFVKLNSFKGGRLIFSNKKPQQDNDEDKSKLSLKKPVSQKKILNAEDYIIYTRGIPRGFSMLNAGVDNINAVAIHHFLCLKPRTRLVDLDLDYLHLMLDLFVEYNLMRLYTDKLEIYNNKPGAFNSISINELKDMKISLLTSVVSQKKAFEKFLQRKTEFETAALSLQNLKNMIYNNIY